MSSEPLFEKVFTVEGKDYIRAGSVSIEIRKILEGFGIDPETTRRVAIITYEAEINIALYADRGELKLLVFPGEIRLEIEDKGPGIENIEMALENGYSTATAEMRELGFGAGMGLPNIERNSDEFSITSTFGEGTKLSITIKPKVAIPS